MFISTDFGNYLGDALSKGAFVVLNITKVLTTGAATAGKTCTIHYIFDKPQPDQYTSTDIFESMERHYAYYSAVVDPQDPCEWKIATLYKTLAMIKNFIISKKKSLMLDDELGFDFSIDSPPTASTTDTQVSTEGPDSSPTASTTDTQVSPEGPDSPPTASTTDTQVSPEGPDSPPTASTTDTQVSAEGPKDVPETVHSVTREPSHAIEQILNLNTKLRISGEVLNLHWIHFVDGGGQSEFLELLPALVSNVSVTIYVIDLSRKPDECCNDFFTISDRPQGERQTCLTGKELFERFLKMICSQKDDERCKVMFVGTHYDDSSSKIRSNLEEWDKLIRTFWSEYDTEKKVKIVNTIDNRNVHAINANFRGDGEQITAKYLRKKLTECCVQRKVAIAEFLIEEDLKSSSLAKTYHGILTYSQCLEITKQYATEYTLKKALQYFHELNEFIFFQNEDLVFTKPGVLVRIISKLIKVAHCCRGNPCHHTDFWKFGLVSGENLNELLDYRLPYEEFSATTYFRAGVFEGNELLKVLQNLFIAASCQHAGLSAHFIPCVLPPYSKADDINKSTLDFMKKNHPLLLTFNRGSIPHGLFCGVVTYLLNVCGWEIRLRNEQNYRTLIEFVIPEKYKLVLVEEFRLIRAHAAQAARRAVRLKVRKNITDGVEAIGKKFYGTEDDSIMCPNASFECSITCPHSQENELSHIASVVSHKTDAMERRLVCEKSGEKIEFTEEHFDWLHEDEDPRLSGMCIIQKQSIIVSVSTIVE